MMVISAQFRKVIGLPVGLADAPTTQPISEVTPVFEFRSFLAETLGRSKTLSYLDFAP
jgi:hypothetical protein